MSRNLHTIFSFNLPFIIPIPDRIYEVTMGSRSALILTKRVWRKQVAGFTSQTGRVQIMFDRYGISGYTHVEIKFPWKMPERNLGRQVTLFVEPHISAPRNKNKETAIKFLNRLIEAVRIVYDQFHLRNVRYSDILSWDEYYWDGKKRISAGSHFDHGCGGIKATAGKMSEEQARKETEKLQRMRSILKNDIPIPLEQIFLANAKDACLEEDFQTATLEGVTALETALYRFIRSRGEQLGISSKDLEGFIVKMGLTGNFKIVLKMLTKGFEQPDEEVMRRCSEAIMTRNKILHERLRAISPSETEQRIQDIENMITYLTRWYIWLGIYQEI